MREIVEDGNIFRVIRHGDEATGTNYTIYLEHLGGFLPILKGKKTSKLKPEFVIFDPLKGITVNLYCFIRLWGNSNKPTIFSSLQILKTHFKSRVYMESSRNLLVRKVVKLLSSREHCKHFFWFRCQLRNGLHGPGGDFFFLQS